MMFVCRKRRCCWKLWFACCSWQQQAAAAADQGAATASTFTAQAVCCALIFSIDATGEREQTEQYLTKVQRHLEEAGAGSLAQDVAYSLKLAKHIVKVRSLILQAHSSVPAVACIVAA